jgi:4-hydroxybutyrate dehydrogenase
MVPLLPLPRLVFGSGALSALAGELTLLGVYRPLLVSDRGLERAGAVALAMAALPGQSARFLDVPENPTAAAADEVLACYQDAGCDGIVALGGGSVIDTAKIVAALVAGAAEGAAGLLGKPELIGPSVAPLTAIPTTVGTGSESSPVAALHLMAGGPVLGTRSPFLVPRVAICDPDLARTLPPRLVAATGIDALSHCLEGFLAEPVNPVVDALALDGLARAFASIGSAIEPGGDDARASLMAAAFAGGAAIHKGLGPAHAIALACGDQDLHHGVLIAAALPLTIELVAQHAPAKAAAAAKVMGLAGGEALAGALRSLVRTLGLPSSYREAGYRVGPMDQLVAAIAASPFNRSTPYVPTSAEYEAIVRRLLA